MGGTLSIATTAFAASLSGSFFSSSAALAPAATDPAAGLVPEGMAFLAPAGAGPVQMSVADPSDPAADAAPSRAARAGTDDTPALGVGALPGDGPSLAALGGAGPGLYGALGQQGPGAAGGLKGPRDAT